MRSVRTGPLRILLLILIACIAPRARAAAFDDWAAVVVAGDFRAHGDVTTEAFDNARRDVARTLTSLGFQRQNLREFSVRPERYRDARPLKSDLKTIYETLSSLTKQTGSGCLVYLTTHGAPQGAAIGDQVLSPPLLGAILERTCAERPTIVVLSACYSGVFLPYVAAPNRMVLTAARPDRTSFGCGQNDTYPYFDQCFLQSVPRGGDFTALAAVVRACVTRREQETGMSPPSEPQLTIGAQIRPLLPLYAFAPLAEPAARGGAPPLLADR